MSIRSCSLTALSTLILASCSTNHFDRNNAFSNTGTEYTEAVDDLIVQTRDRVIRVNSELLITSPRKEAEERQKDIDKHTERMKQLVDMIEAFRHHNRVLGRYFAELKTASETRETSDIGSTLSELSAIIANLNREGVDMYGAGAPLRMSSGQKHHVGIIADRMVKHHFGKQLKRQILQDRDIIEKQMFLQGKQLDQLIDLMLGVIDDGNSLYADKYVVGPYVSGEIGGRGQTSAEGWIQSRVEWFKRRQTREVFEKAKEAQLAMLWAWRDIVRGKRDLSSINSSIKDINAFVGSASALHVSTKKSSQSTTTFY